MSFCVSNLPFSLGTFQGRLRQVSLHGREWRMHLKALNLKVRGYNQRHKNGDETSEFFSCAGTWTHGVWKSFWWTLDTLLNSQPTPPPGQRCFRSPSWSYQTSPDLGGQASSRALAVEWNDFLPGNGTFGEVKVKDETWENGSRIHCLWYHYRFIECFCFMKTKQRVADWLWIDID